MKLTLNGRPVEVDSVNHGRHDSCDSFIERAFWLDTEVELTDEECYQLSEENPEFLYEQWHENMIDRAEFYADMHKDGTYD